MVDDTPCDRTDIQILLSGNRGKGEARGGHIPMNKFKRQNFADAISFKTLISRLY